MLLFYFFGCCCRCFAIVLLVCKKLSACYPLYFEFCIAKCNLLLSCPSARVCNTVVFLFAFIYFLLLLFLCASYRKACFPMGGVCSGFMCIRVAEISTSVFRNDDIPNIGRSDYRSAEMPISAFRASDLGTKECLCLVCI